MSGMARTSSFPRSWSTSASPSPSIFMARREAKCRSDSRSLAGQEGLVQREMTSPSGLNAAEPQTGQWSGKANFFSFPVRLSFITATTLGMTSPLRSMSTQSPTRMSLRRISSSLWRVDRDDGRAGQAHGLEVGDRRQGAGPSDLDPDAENPGRGLAGRKLEGDRPAGRLGGRPERRPLRGRIDLDDDSVDIVIEAVPLFPPLLPVVDDLLKAPAVPGVGVGLEALAVLSLCRLSH